MLVIATYLSGELDDRFSLERMRVSRLLPKFGRLSALLATSALLIPVYYTHAASTTTTTTVKTKTVSGSQTTPIVTNGADVTIASGGSITVGKGAAVTVNSSNSVDNEGTITGNNGMITGILVTKGGTGNILNDATITITDSTLATTIPLTQGEHRYGIQIDSATPYVGTITNSANGSIIVRGNDSAGIYLNKGGLKGSIDNAGFIGITGNDSFGILVNATAPITGAGHGISVSNSITALGTGSGALKVDGTVAGSIDISSVVRSDGYYSGGQVTLSRPTDFTGLGPSAFLQGGSAISIGATIGHQILVDPNGEVVTYGSAPALLIKPGVGKVANIGVTGDKTDPSIEVDSSIRANGIYDGVSASAIQIGGGGGTVTIGRGIDNRGLIEATAYASSAAAITIGTGATVTSLRNSGEILSTVNFGQNNAVKDGQSSTAILDTGGALKSIINTGVITATAVAGRAVALDMRADTEFLTVKQLPGKPTTTTTTTPTFTTTNTTATVPSITGSILFGSQGADLEVDAGTIAGAVRFGDSTANVLTLDNGGVLGGAITQAAGGRLNLRVLDGRLASSSIGTLVLSKLKIGADGQIDFAVNPATGQSGSLTVDGSGVGAVLISSGAKIGLTLNSQLTTPETFTVIQTTGASAGALVGQSSLLLGDVAYFYDAKVITDAAGGTVDVNIHDRTFAQAGVLGSASAYDAIFKANYNDPGIRDAFNAAAGQQGFKRLFQQMLPTYSGGVFEVLAQGADSLARTEAGNPIVESGGRSGGWAQQFGFGAVDSTSSAPGYHGGGLGFAFGWETPASAISSWGVTVAYMRGAADDFNTGPGNEQIGTTYTVGAYWREVDGALRTDASINIGGAEFNSQRNFSGTDLTNTAVLRTADAAWSGGVAQAHIGVSYEEPLGDDFYVKPSVSGDYFMLYSGGYSEHNGGKAFDLAVDSQTDKQGSVTGGLTVGMQLGDSDFTWRPEVMVGYKEVFGGPDQTVAQFAGGSSFFLSPKSQKGGAVGHIGVHGGNKYSDIAIEAGGEDRGDYRAFDGRVVARFKF
jgi:hypothetical protein